MNSRHLLTWLSNFVSFGRPLLPFTLHCCLHSRHSISLTTLLQSAMASYLDLLLRSFIIPNFLLLSLHFGQIRRLCLTCSTGSHAHHIQLPAHLPAHALRWPRNPMPASMHYCPPLLQLPRCSQTSRMPAAWFRRLRAGYYKSKQRCSHILHSLQQICEHLTASWLVIQIHHGTSNCYSNLHRGELRQHHSRQESSVSEQSGRAH